MYSIRQRFKTVRQHLEDLRKNGTPSEAFLCSMFVVEKVLRRVLLQLIMSAGFTREHALKLCKSIRGFQAMKKNWRYYDPKHRSLAELIGNPNWQTILKAADLRNDLVHGNEHKQETTYRKEVRKVLKVLDEIKTTFESTYDYGGWRGMKDRDTTTLHTDPLVKT